MKYMSFLLTGCALMLGVAGNAQVKKKPAAAGSKKTITRKTATAASSGGNFQKGPHDLQYKIVKHGKGTVSPQIGDHLSIYMKQRIDDSLIINSNALNMGKPLDVQVQQPQVPGDLWEGLTLLKEGDSAVFRIPLDTMINRLKQPRPEWPRKNAKVIWEVKVLAIRTKAQVDAEANAKKKMQVETDDKLIREYIQKKGITNAKKTASGLYYVVTKEGSGPNAAPGQKATVNYTGVNINDEKFDSNVDPAFNHVSPFQFDLGAHGVIAGWDEGVALMNKGMKATFFIPSALAYGDRARSAQIPANAVLIFDIELVDFQ